MNKRQAKKKFKKQYGVTPEEMQENVLKAIEAFAEVDWDVIMGKFAEAVNKTMETVIELIQNFSEALQEETE